MTTSVSEKTLEIAKAGGVKISDVLEDPDITEGYKELLLDLLGKFADIIVLNEK